MKYVPKDMICGKHVSKDGSLFLVAEPKKCAFSWKIYVNRARVTPRRATPIEFLFLYLCSLYPQLVYLEFYGCVYARWVPLIILPAIYDANWCQNRTLCRQFCLNPASPLMMQNHFSANGAVSSGRPEIVWTLKGVILVKVMGSCEAHKERGRENI